MYKVILVEGLSDESFMLEYLNQKYDIRYGLPMDAAIRYNKCITIRDYNKNYLTKLSGSKSQLFNDAKIMARDSSNGFLPAIIDIGIIADLDEDSYEDLVYKYFQSLNATYPGDVEQTSFGVRLFGKNIHVMGIGNQSYCHLCEHWSHTLEDIVIETITKANDSLTEAYDNITIDAIEKGTLLDLHTCTKSPINITMAFSDAPDSLAGFYKMMVAKNTDIVENVLHETGFLDRFIEFLTS